MNKDWWRFKTFGNLIIQNFMVSHWDALGGYQFETDCLSKNFYSKPDKHLSIQI